MRREAITITSIRELKWHFSFVIRVEGLGKTLTYPLTLKWLPLDTCIADANVDVSAEAELAYANKNKERPFELRG